MSRNDERLGLPVEERAPASMAGGHTPTMGGSFEWAVPTYIVPLPTAGKYYDEGHPCHGVDQIEIRYMTAKEEDMLTSEHLLREGVAHTRVVQNLILDPKISVRDMLVQDVTALMVAARITGYGSEYNVSVRCPACLSTVDHSFNVEEVLHNSIETTRSCLAQLPTPYSSAENRWLVDVTLPLTKAQVAIRWLSGADEERISKAAYKKSDMTESLITDLLRSMVVSINGEDNPIAVAHLIKTMPTQDGVFLRNSYVDMIPTFKLQQTYECQSCGHTADTEVPLNATFFWPN